MFRNIYIQAYKNSIQQNHTLQLMLIHANHIYAGLGCILQDIEFMVGNVLTHIKNTNAHARVAKNQVKERVSMPEKLDKNQQDCFKMPKYQFLPSSSFKYDNFQAFRPKLNPPLQQQQMRSHNMLSSRNDSFEEMFPQKKKTKPSLEGSDNDNQKYNREKGNNRNSKGNSNSNATVTPSRKQTKQASQQDFMDYLFNKKNKQK